MKNAGQTKIIAEIGSLVITPSQIKILKKEYGIDIVKLQDLIAKSQIDKAIKKKKNQWDFLEKADWHKLIH